MSGWFEVVCHRCGHRWVSPYAQPVTSAYLLFRHYWLRHPRRVAHSRRAP